ncbi:hypothetical protein L210DRAFT_3541761 [Boletus edulis BED1]|uniref:Uncharacterized protein n=1 Tax=Boletus edulis BED1 TaxID=1328754 RepID=A0AAD4BT65_BOLED|nr:hypothetical protein L210DRAFT_3541761 [Boletus edulis BED1]
MQLSCEEHKYLAVLRREKESFERLIKERGVQSDSVLTVIKSDPPGENSEETHQFRQLHASCSLFL